MFADSVLTPFHRTTLGDAMLSASQEQAIAKWWEENGDGYEYADNFRHAIVGNVEQEQEYKRIYDGGCCGACDVLLEVDGETLMYGFNYGH